MRVSIVVPTYRRAPSLGRCLDAIARQSRPADEVIVVARPDDEASSALARARARPVRVVAVHRPGVVAAMNAGLDASSGDVVALTDDDAEPHADWIERILATYAADDAIAAVGGRDFIYAKGALKDGAERVVGVVGRFGRITGNHHLGVGPPRDVDVLKGANLSVRGELLRAIRFDERLLGLPTENHWELALCLKLRRLGFRIVYDPAIAVDHHPQPRVAESRPFGSRELRASAHNASLALLEHLPRWRRGAYLAFAIAIGTSETPGLAQMVRLALRRRPESAERFCTAQSGLALGLRTYRRSRRAPAQTVCQRI